MPENTQNHRDSFLFPFTITLIWSAFVFFLLTIIYQLDPAVLGKRLLSIFYRPHYNNCLFEDIGDFHVAHLIYFIIVLSSLSVHFFRLKRANPESPTDLMHTLKQVACAAFCIVLALQTINQAIILKIEHKHYASKPPEKRYHSSVKPLYDSGTFFKKIFPGPHSAKLISDMNIKKDPGMFLYSAFSYYLYPIDIRGVRQEPYDSAIVIKKKDPLDSIPKDFRVIGVVDEKYFLAVKRNLNE